MKPEFILLLMMLVFATGVSPEAPAYQDQRVDGSIDYELSAISMGVYELVTPLVTADNVTARCYPMFGFRGTPVEDNGIFRITSGNRTFEMDSRDGSMYMADYTKLWNLSLGIEIPTPANCKVIADDFLLLHGLYPGLAGFSSTDAGIASAYNPSTQESLTKTLHYQVNYVFELGGYPVTGPGAKISVIVGEGGDIIGFNWNWREVVLRSTVQTMEYDDILEINGISEDDVVSQGLTYYAGPDDEHEEFLLPTYEILVEEEYGDETIQVPLIVDSTEFTPMVSIVLPTGVETVYAGDQLTFNCSILNGEGPYTINWESSIDGHLSDDQTFATSDLTAALRNETALPHLITVTVTDANGLVCTDFIELTVVEGPSSTYPDWLPIVLLAGIGLIVLLVIIKAGKSRMSALLFLLFLCSAFLVLPIASAQTEYSAASTLDLETRYRPMSAYDEGIKEVGIEWVGLTGHPPLGNTQTNIEGFYNIMGSTGGYNKEFNWGEYSAWEQDFKMVSKGGTDTDWVDAVDFVYYQDHGNPNGVCFSSEHDDGFIGYWECEWGDGDLEWIVMDACSPLAWMEPNSGKNVWERWTPVLKGLHLILSFATGSSNVQTRGTRFANYLIAGHTLVNAWFWACAETQGSDCLAAVLYATESNDPWNPQLSDPINDHAHGFGYVCADPTSPKWFVYITAQC